MLSLYFIDMNSSIVKLNNRIYEDNLFMHTNGLPCGVLFASPLRHSCGVYILMQLTKDGRKFSNLIMFVHDHM